MATFSQYVKLSEIAASLGGPVQGAVKVGTALVIAGGGLFYGGQQLVRRVIVPAIKRRNAPSPLVGQTFTVTAPGDDGHGLAFSVGDQFRVVGTEKDVIFLKVDGDEEMPRFTSSEFLRTVSSFRNERGPELPN